MCGSGRNSVLPDYVEGTKHGSEATFTPTIRTSFAHSSPIFGLIMKPPKGIEQNIKPAVPLMNANGGTKVTVKV